VHEELIAAPGMVDGQVTSFRILDDLDGIQHASMIVSRAITPCGGAGDILENRLERILTFRVSRRSYTR